MPLPGPPEAVTDPARRPWQGNPWVPCDDPALIFTGPADEADKPAAVGNFTAIQPKQAQDRTILIGIRPRIPTTREYEPLTQLLPGLAGSCWWVTDDFAEKYYNCHGYVIARETGMVQHRDPFSLLGRYDAFLAPYFRKLDAAVGGEIPSLAVVAVFSGNHTAKRSYFQRGGEDLWESKLGGSGAPPEPRILHLLKAIEGGEYGDVVAWYGRA